MRKKRILTTKGKRFLFVWGFLLSSVLIGGTLLGIAYTEVSNFRSEGKYYNAVDDNAPADEYGHQPTKIKRAM
ncbi:MAG: hypothetical protein WAV16_02445 [Candidatus Moraniibacteriota bacterium]